MINSKNKTAQRLRRRTRIRAKVSGTTERPRLSVFKSNKFIYAQIIDDTTGKTLVAVSTEGSKAKTPLLAATEAGKTVAEMAGKKGVKAVVFDRGGYIYTGKIKAIADGAREGGLAF
jgi:large subunit ribosomal protein L18